MGRLLDQISVKKNRSHLKEWEQDAFEKFKFKLTDKKFRFPCIPATQGFALEQFRYGFIEWSENTYKEFATMLREYNENSRTFGKYTSLIVFFDGITEKGHSNDIDDYFSLFWNLLEHTSELDESDWPEHIPQDPSHKLWQYCFNGDELFVYCATPSHIKRQSRSFPYFMLAVTPRWVFDTFRKNQKHADNIKGKIHGRLENYDDIGIHSDLRLYGDEDNFEWKQYFLRDDDQSPKSCPFSKK